MSKVLRPHQQQALDLLKRSIASGKRRPMIQAPTGMGKTVLGSAIVQGALRKNNRVVFCVPAIELVDQTVMSFWEDGINDVGVIQANHELTSMLKPVQVASVQTLARRALPPADVVVVDEAHRKAQVIWDWMAHPEWADVPFVGLSATPWSKGLGKHFDDLIIASTTNELIEEGYLSPFQVYAPSHPDLSGVKITAGDYREDQLSEVMQDNDLVADIVQTWLDKGEGRPTLCFAVDRAHAKTLQKEFARHGVSAGYVDAHTDRPDRKEIQRKFGGGEYQVVCNVGVLTTGVDWDVRCIILARPTKSEILFTQIVGRGLRTAAGKEDCLILDHSDTHLRLGFVTDIHHEKLDAGDKKDRNAEARELLAKLPRECPVCSHLVAKGEKSCSNCGFTPEKVSDLKPGPGELELLKSVKPKEPVVTQETKQRWYSGLLYIQRYRGKKPGWVAHTYRDKFGVWPQGMSNHPMAPTPEVEGFVRHKNIRFAKQREAANA